MKQIPVDECPAGTYLDVAVVKAQYHGEHLVIDFKHRLFSTSDRAISCIKLSRYSTDIAAAWELIDRMGTQYAPSIYQIGQWYCNFLVDGGRIESCAETAPLAITRAYLKVEEVEFVEVPDETNTG